VIRTKLALAFGLTVILVLVGSVAASASDLQPQPTVPVFYTVRAGDSLSSIAKARLGSTGKWRQLYQMNRSVIGNNPNRLVVGEVLMLVKGILRQRAKSTVAGPQLSHSGPLLIDAQAATKIKHVFVIMQENHTFDNYFGTYPGADGLPASLNIPLDPAVKAGPVAPPYHLPSLRTQDLDHSQISALAAYNSGRMNGFVVAQQDRNLPGALALGYYDGSDIPLYWDLANNYVLADRFFSSAMGGSLANHQYWVGAKDSGMGESIPANGIQMTTIFDRLEGAGYSWKFYVKNYDSTLDFRHIDPSNPKDSQVAWVPLLTIPSIVDNPAKKARIQDLGNLYHDLADTTVPSVSYIVQGGTSEHPPGHVGNGQNSTVGIITAIMRSQSWKDSAILLTWDDWGGWYDHVVPPQVDGDGYGFRVPTLIISPYAKKGYILHDTADFTSILKFIERLHGLAPLTTRDEAATDLMSAFDFQQAPRAPSQPPIGGFPSLITRGPSVVALVEMYGVIGGLALLLLALAAMTGRRRRRAI
jgi:phospholipase C